MEMERRSPAALRGAIDGIAHDRPSHGGAMDAQLVRAAGQRRQSEPSDVLGSRGKVAGRGFLACRSRHSAPKTFQVVTAALQRDVVSDITIILPDTERAPMARISSSVQQIRKSLCRKWG
jgi:hypothetical protein